MKKQVVFSILFSFFCLSIISLNAFAKETESLTIINVSFGEESISVKTDKGEYILPSHSSGMLDEATFEKILLLLKNKTNKGKTFSFIVEQSNDIDFVITQRNFRFYFYLFGKFRQFAIKQNF